VVQTLPPLRHQRSKTTRVGGSRYSSFTSPHRFFYRSNLCAVPIACLFKIGQFLNKPESCHAVLLLAEPGVNIGVKINGACQGLPLPDCGKTLIAHQGIAVAIPYLIRK
jgi:hypothetical protein